MIKKLPDWVQKDIDELRSGKPIKCPDCNGTGESCGCEDCDHRGRCFMCNGKGKVIF